VATLELLSRKLTFLKTLAAISKEYYDFGFLFEVIATDKLLKYKL
jgi:hypothetical protein